MVASAAEQREILGNLLSSCQPHVGRRITCHLQSTVRPSRERADSVTVTYTVFVLGCGHTMEVTRYMDRCPGCLTTDGAGRPGALTLIRRKAIQEKSSFAHTQQPIQEIDRKRLTSCVFSQESRRIPITFTEYMKGLFSHRHLTTARPLSSRVSSANLLAI